MRTVKTFMLIAALTIAAAAASTAQAADAYNVDAAHSSIVFKIGHNGVGEVFGRFNAYTGSFEYDTETGLVSNMKVAVRADSVDTGIEARDNHIKNQDFFNANQFREITFTSKSTTKADDGSLSVTGDLTYRGQTKPVTVKLNVIGSRNTGRQGFRTGFSAAFTMKRSDYGDTYGTANGSLSDEVTFMIGLQGVRQ